MCKPKLQYDNSRMSEAIAECIHSKLHREVLHAILIDGWTYERTAETVDRTPRQVAYIVERSIPKLSAWICQKIS